MALVLLLTGPLYAAEPWHLPGWTARAAVEVTKPAADRAVDCASVKVLLHGRGKPDGADIRVLDAAGKPVPFQVTFHEPARYALLTFKCADPKARYFVYFGNPAAAGGRAGRGR